MDSDVDDDDVVETEETDGAMEGRGAANLYVAWRGAGLTSVELASGGQWIDDNIAIV